MAVKIKLTRSFLTSTPILYIIFGLVLGALNQFDGIYHSKRFSWTAVVLYGIPFGLFIFYMVNKYTKTVDDKEKVLWKAVKSGTFPKDKQFLDELPQYLDKISNNYQGAKKYATSVLFSFFSILCLWLILADHSFLAGAFFVFFIYMAIYVYFLVNKVDKNVRLLRIEIEERKQRSASKHR